MKTTKWYHHGILGIGMVVFSLLGSCTLSGPSIGRIELTLGSGAGGKTVLPVVSVSSYLISFSGGPVAKDPVSTTQSNPTIELEVGTWNIGVEGKDSGGKVVAVGSAIGVVVTVGATTPVSIVLSAQSSGTGTIDVTVTWPGTVTPGIDATVVTLDGNAVPGGTLSTGATSVRYVEEKGAGNYRLSVNLYSGAVLRASVQEAVQVYGNLSSTATIALVDADFTSPPAAPSGLVVTEGLGKLDLSWVDNSDVETGYVVERSTGDALHFGVLNGSLPPTPTSYSDTTAAVGQTYWYRVKATNFLGDSGYSNEESGKVEPPVAGGSGVLTFDRLGSTSTQVSWQKAADNASSETALSYKVVCSLTNNVSTVGQAETNGILVQDWTLDIMTVDATGLIAGTPYYFNVLVKDGAGNIGAYVSGGGTGSLSITITVTSPQNEAMTFDQVDDIVVAANATLHITIGEGGFSSYAWLLDGVVLPGQITATVDIDCSVLVLGAHHLSLFVQKNGMMYSKTLRFRIGN